MAYTDALCPMEGCDEPLYITWRMSRPVFQEDTVEDLQDPTGAYTAGWQIECEEGHVVLLPVNPPGASRDIERFGDDEEDTPAELHDMPRLNRLIKGANA